MNRPGSLTTLAVVTVVLGAVQLLTAGQARARPAVQNGFYFDAPSYSVAEAAGQAEITILRAGSTADAASVRFVASRGSATANVDYTPVDERVDFAPGVTSRTVPISVVNDSEGEGDETVRLTLSEASGAPLDKPNDVYLTIVDDDTGFAFALDSFFCAETDGTSYVTVFRLGPSSGADSVQYASADGTATAGSDYKAVSGTLSFAEGQGIGMIRIPIVDDTRREGAETIQLTLSNPSPGTSLSKPSTATVTILDNERKALPAKKTAGRITSARLTKRALSISEAGLVKLIYRIYPRSTRFSYVLSRRLSSSWSALRRVRKKGNFAGKRTMTVRRLFGKVPIASGTYRLKLSADKNSKTLTFSIR